MVQFILSVGCFYNLSTSVSISSLAHDASFSPHRVRCKILMPVCSVYLLVSDSRLLY